MAARPPHAGSEPLTAQASREPRVVAFLQDGISAFARKNFCSPIASIGDVRRVRERVEDGVGEIELRRRLGREAKRSDVDSVRPAVDDEASKGQLDPA